MRTSEGFLNFQAVVNGQTYLNILYHLISFPLGLFYFIFLVTGILLGLGLLIVWIGVPLLIGVFAASRGLSAFERLLAVKMLGSDIAPRPLTEKTPGIWNRIKSLVTDPATWKGILYLFLRFPLGIFSFSVAISLISVSLSLIAAPVYFWVPWTSGIWLWEYHDLWLTYSPFTAFLVIILVLIFGFISLHLLNGLAQLYGSLAEVMLGEQPG